MSVALIPDVFLSSAAATVVLLAASSLTGRSLAAVLPWRLRAAGIYYLSPVLGLAVLVVLASAVARYVPLGLWSVSLLLVLAPPALALVWERDRRAALGHALIAGLFGLLCGISVFVPAFTLGAINAHNDTFTYLAHADWLQTHAFAESLSLETVTPVGTQVQIYQDLQLRMGGSYLLAVIQSLFVRPWAYEVYPAVVAAPLGACCLALGFPLACTLRSLKRPARLALLCIPAFSLGGLVFGANMGFLPQTLGLSFGAGLLFLLGPVLVHIGRSAAIDRPYLGAALPSAVLLAAVFYVYPEFAPFLCASIGASVVFVAVRMRAAVALTGFAGAATAITLLLLNVELSRAYHALQLQSGAIVGTPVDWIFPGFVAHALGAHGGASDVWEWAKPANPYALTASGVLFAVLLVMLVTARPRRSGIGIRFPGSLLPAVIMLGLLTVALLYFRYGVPSPFPVGTGQSWSQFKLAEWAHPFAMLLVVWALARQAHRYPRLRHGAIAALFAAGVWFAIVAAQNRSGSIAHYYAGASDVYGFYRSYREAVLANCNAPARVYLALEGEHHKFRQMAALFLPDRALAADWTDDDYISPWIAAAQRAQQPIVGDCVVEPAQTGGLLEDGVTIGHVRVGVLGASLGRIRVAATHGAHDRESDGHDWWHWIERRVEFELQAGSLASAATRTAVRFEYRRRSPQTLTIRLRVRARPELVLQIPGSEPAVGVFRQVLDVAPSDLLGIAIETDGVAEPLGEGDARLAAWMLRNLSILPMRG